MAKKVANQAAIKNLSSFVSPQTVRGNKQAAAVSELQKEMNKTADTGGVFFSTPTPFQPEFGDPSKINFPIDRHQANRYWRLSYRTDPIVGSVIDMFAEMLTSDIDLYGEGVTGEIKRAYEQAITDTNIVSMFQYFIKEFLVVGEVVPHLIFDESKGIWSDLIFHNPDQVNVLSSSFLNVPTILEFVPDEGLRKFITSQHPQVLDYIQTLPAEIVSAIASGQNVPLNTKFNVSFLARKLFPYDTRGTSIMPRMWQIDMYESACFNSAIATARRHCFVAGTSVMMSDGLKNIEDVKVGDKVITGEGNIKEVVDAWEEPAEGNLIEIKALGSAAITCTENHKFKIWKQNKYCKCGCGESISNGKLYISGHHCIRDLKTGRFNQIAKEYDNYSVGKRVIKGENPIKEVQAKDIEKGDYFLIPRKFEEKPTNISKEQARLLGYYLAEGGLHNCNNRKVVIYYFGGHEHNTIALDAYNCCKSIGLTPTHRLYKKKNDPTRTVGESNVDVHNIKDAWFTEWCIKHGSHKHINKKISEEVLSWPLYLKEELIRGYFRGDGHLNIKSHQIIGASVSKTLIYQLKIVLTQLGIFSSIYKIKRQKENWNDCYQLTSNGDDARKLAKIVWGEDIEFNKTTNKRTFLDDSYIYVPVQKVILSDKKEKTYNLTIEKDHSYIANSISTLNSGPLKICKLGSPEHQFIPPKEFFDEMVQQFTIAESDPHAMLVLPNYGIQFEAFGTTDRMMSISREYEIIERIKMTALGVSAGMMHGESTFACLLKDSMISTSYGAKVPIQDIQIGDTIIDKDGVIQTVEDAWVEGIPDTLTEISLFGGKKIISTHNHRFPVWAWPRKCACGCDMDIAFGASYIQGHNNRLMNNDFIKINGKGTTKGILKNYSPIHTMEASSIKARDYLMIPRKFEELTPEVPIEFARLLGYYIAEGCFLPPTQTCPNKGVQFTFNINEKTTWASDIIELTKSSGMDMFCREAAGNTCVVRGQNETTNNFSEWLLQNGGRYSHGKCLSETVMRWPINYKVELLKGMFRGDGSRGSYIYPSTNKKEYNRFVVAYTTVSSILTDQVCTLLSQIGMYGSIHCSKDNGKRLGRRDSYQVKIFSNQAAELASLVWGDAITVTKKSRTWSDDNYLYVPIKSIRVIENKEKISVYNLTVSGTHSYLVDGIGTFNSSKTNLNTLLMRLKGMRKFFEDTWWKNKFFKPLAEINEWHHRSTAEVNHRVRIKKNANEQRLIVPKIKWRQLLEPVVDKDMLEAIRLLNDLGVKSSKTTSFAAAGLDFEGETVNALTEQKIEKQLRKKILPEDVKDKRPEDIAEEILPGGALPLSMPEELPMTPTEGELPEAAPAGLPPEGEATTPEEAAEAAPGAPPITPAPASKQPSSKRGFKVTANDVADLIDLMETGKTESQIWSYIKNKEEDNNEFIKNCNWDRISDYMEDEDFTNAEIEYIRKALVRKHIIEASLNDKLEDAVETLNLAAVTDAELHSKIDKTISNIFKDKIAKIQEKVKEQDDAFLTGEGNIYSNNDFLVRSGGDLSDKAIKKYRKTKKK